MRYIELDPLPNNGFVVASNFFGIINGKILLGGGSGFKTPLADGGKKLLSNRIMVVSEKNSKWMVHDEVSLIKDGEGYGFCNGASIVIDNTAYFIGGFKTMNQKIVDSDAIIKVWIAPKHKINYQVYENVLPFQGKTTGVKVSHDQALVVNANSLYTIKINHDQNNRADFSVSKVDTKNHLVSGTLPIANNDTIYLFGGYKPFVIDQKESNNFVTDQFLTIRGKTISSQPLVNLNSHPYTFLDGGAVWKNDHQILLIGGVDRDMFCDAVNNLAILKGDELANYRKAYFAKSEEEFNFNRDLVMFDTKTNQLTSLGKFKHGFAGNPIFFVLNNEYYILSGEVKAGVRLTHPIKFTLPV